LLKIALFSSLSILLLESLNDGAISNFGVATIASCISNASACAAFTIYFDLISHTVHIGSIVNPSAEYELS
jgi:hypothetical protein